MRPSGERVTGRGDREYKTGVSLMSFRKIQKAESLFFVKFRLVVLYWV